MTKAKKKMYFSDEDFVYNTVEELREEECLSIGDIITEVEVVAKYEIDTKLKKIAL